MSSTLATALTRAFRAERARCGLSQEELAGLLGWSRQQVTKIESGDRQLFVHEMPEVCRVLGVGMRAFLVQATPEDLEALDL